MTIKQDKLNSKRVNALFRHGFKARHALDVKVVDKHFQALCEFAADVSKNVGQNISVLTPSGIIHFEKKLIDFTFSFKRVGGKGKKKTSKRK